MKFRSTSLRLSIVSLLLVITAAFAAIGAQASGLANALDSVQEFLGMSAPLQSTQSLQNTHLLQSTSKYANYAPGTLKNVATNSALIEPMQPMFFLDPAILTWNTFGNAGTETTEPSTTNNANIGTSTLTMGSGVTPAGNANRFGGVDWFDTGDSNPTTLAQSVAGNDYIQFIVTPNAGFSFTPTSFVFNWDKSGSGPVNVALRSSADGFSSDLGTVVPTAAIGTANTINISGLTALTSATTFRLYGYGATTAAGSGGFDVGSNVVNVQLNGTTAASGTTAPIVSSSAATSITPTGATLNGNVTSDGGSAVTDRGFVYKASSPVTIADNKTNVAGTTGAYTLPLSGLSVNTQYFFDAYGKNVIGTTLSSPELNFWTLANAPTTPTVSSPTQTSLSVTLGSGDGNPATTSYAIHETTTNKYVQANGTLNTSAVYQTAATWATIAVTGLTSNTTYTFEVKARNGANTDTAFSPTASGLTSPGAPGVSTQAASAVTSADATLNGTVTSNGGGTISDRGFYWSATSGVTLGSTQLSEGGTTVSAFSKALLGLGANTQYFYRAYATNQTGTTLDSTDTTFTTLANTPVAPVVSNATRYTVDVAVGSGDGNSGTVTYAIQETTSGNYVTTGGTLGTVAYQTAAAWGTKTVTGLNPSTTYTFQVKSRNSASVDSPSGPTASLQTLLAPPVLAAWDVNGQPGGTGNYGTSPLTAAQADANTTVGGLTRGSGVTSAGSGAANAWGGNGWNVATEALAISGNKFATFTIAANTGKAVSLDSFSKFFYRTSSSPNAPTNGAIQYSIDGTNFTDITNSISWAANTQSSIGVVDLSGVSALQNVPYTKTVTLRIVNWGGAASSGNWYVNNGNATGNDLEVIGSTSNVYTLNYAAGANGSLSGSTTQTVAPSTDGTAISAVPATGYHFVNWSDGSTANPRTDTNVQADKSVTANFAINTYTLTYTAGANGSITGTSPQTVNYNASGSAVTAVPATGYHFVNWSDLSATNPRTDLNVTADVTVTANFAINTYTLTYTAGSNGSITGTSPQTVNYGADGSTVTAVPAATYHFVNWSDLSTANPRTDTNVQGNISVTANFAINTYTLTYTAGSNGSITGTSPQTVNSGASGSAVTAVPAANYHFVNWSDLSTANPRTDSNVAADVTVTANFAINTYTLTYTAGSNGSITGTSPQTVNYNASGSAVTAVPAANYHFVSWSDASTANPRTDSNVTADITVTATFAIDTHTLTYTAGANGSITGTSPQTVNHGADGSAVTAVPNSGYQFVNWSDSSVQNPRTDTNVQANISVTANFAASNHTVTFNGNTSTSGTMTPQVSNVAANLSNNQFLKTGYTFVDWTTNQNGTGTHYANQASYPFTADATLYAQWTINTYQLTVGVGQGQGTTSPSGTSTVNHGASTPISATDGTGYHFVDWVVAAGGANASVLSSSSASTTVSLTGNATVNARFALNQYAVTYTAGANGSISGNASQTVNHGNNGTPVTANPDPGYVFVNWSDASTQNPRTDMNVQGPISVTANFAAESHTVMFDANGGTNTMANQTANAPTALSTNTFVRSGYTFTGWNTAANGSGDPYANNAIYPFTADATLYAQWNANTCHTLTADTGAVSHSTYFGAAITVPVSVSTTTTAEGVISADFDMAYDPAVIRAVHVGTSDVVTATRGAAIIHNSSSGNVTVSEVYATPGTVHVSVYDTAGFDTTNGNTLVNISFTVVGHAGTHSALTLPPSGTNPGDTKFGNAAAGFLCADVVPGDVSVAARATTTSVSTSHPNPAGSTYGTSVTFTATVSTTGTPAVSGGSVNFYDGGTDCGAGHGTSLGTVALTGNSAALSTSVLGASATDHTIWACYTGDGADFSASSNTVAQHVNPKPVAPAVTADDKIYDGNADAIVHCSIPGKVSGDDVACTAGGPNTFDSKNVGDPKTVTARNITLTGLTAGNYVLTTPTATTTAKITERDLNVTATADDKTYDGNTTAVVHLTSDKVAADTVTLSNTSADFDTKSVGDPKTVTVLGISIGGADAPNYHLVNTSTTATAKITGRPLTVTATGINKVYDSTIAATVTLSSNKVSGDVVALHYTTATFADKNVDTGKAVSVSGISIDGADSGNYTLSNTTATTSADITPATLTVTAHGVNKTYDGGTAATVTLTDDHLGSDVVTTGYTTATFAQSNAGTGILVNVSGISITGGADANNYTLNGVTTATTSADIDKKSVTPSVTVLDRAYNGSDVAAIDTCTVAVKVGLDDVACSAGGPNTFDSRNAGLRTATARGIILTGSTKDNYTLGAISTATTTATITKLDVNVTAVTDTKTYDGTTSSVGTPTVSPSIISPDTGTFTQAFVGKNVGIGKTITPSGTVDDGNGGLNYSLHFISDTTGVISARAITVTASSDTKGYDGTTNSSATPTVTVGSIASGDTAAFTQSFDTKNVGINKTLTPTGSVSDTNGGANYAVTFATNTTGVITARAITVTAATDTKGYDGNASSAGIPTVTSGSLAPGDTSGFTQAFADRNVGTSKTINASGIVNDGNSGNNYTVTLVANTTGVITARAITVTAATDTKTYDGSTSSAGVPTITTGSLVGGDTATFTQTFDTKNVGTGKILTPAGTVSDGNSGHNYAVTFATNTTGVINAKAITVTAVSATKVYDGGTTAAGTPTISPALVGGDTSGFTQAFAIKHVGTNKTINASGVVVDGNGGNNYTVAFVANTTGEITKLAITVTATAATKTYDGGVTSAGIPTITSGSLVGGDTAVFSQTYDNRKAGTGKTLTPTGTITDGNSGGNYDVTYTPVTTGVINKLDVTVTAIAATKAYDGDTSSAGVPTVVPALIGPDTGSFIQTYDTRNAGLGKTLTPSGTITDGNGGLNYTVTFVANTAGVINKRATTVTAVTDSKPYDGNTSSAGIPTVSPAVIGPDIGTFSQTFDTPNPGTGKTLTPTGTVNDGNGGLNYDLNFVAVNTGSITTGTLTGTVTNIIASSKPIPGVTVTATGTPVRTGTTALPSGGYSITGFGPGTYTFGAAKDKQGCSVNNGITSDITSDDAALVSQYVVHLHAFTPDQQLAAHVSSVTSSISSLDAALIAQKVVGNCHPNNRSGEWVFNSGSLGQPTTVTTNKVDDFTGFMMGDVDGSWDETGANRPAEENTAASPNAVIGSVPETAADPATQVTIPFRIDNLAGKTVRSTQFDIVYDPAVVDAVGASVQGTNADSLGVVSNVPTPGLLKVAVYGAVPVGGDGVYVNLTFTVKGGAGSSTPLTVKGFRFNANTDEVTSVSGRITVTGEAAAATFNGRLVSASGRTIGGGTITLRSTAGVVFTMGPTGKSGIFSFTGLKANETYTVSVTSARYTFAVRQVTTSQSLTSMDLIADQ